jgi:hypothetical protein
MGLRGFSHPTHGSRRGLHSSAASRLPHKHAYKGSGLRGPSYRPRLNGSGRLQRVVRTAAERRQNAAHGASHGEKGQTDKPQRGERTLTQTRTKRTTLVSQMVLSLIVSQVMPSKKIQVSVPGARMNQAFFGNDCPKLAAVSQSEMRCHVHLRIFQTTAKSPGHEIGSLRTLGFSLILSHFINSIPPQQHEAARNKSASTLVSSKGSTIQPLPTLSHWHLASWEFGAKTSCSCDWAYGVMRRRWSRSNSQASL